MSRALDAIIGKTTSRTDPSAAVGGASSSPATDINAALAQDAAEPDTYRPYRTWPHPQVMFSVIERDGFTEHAFQYHTVRHPKIERRNNVEFLRFTADGLAVTIQGVQLRPILLALKRYVLTEIREFDGKRPGALPTRIDKLEVVDAQEQLVRPPAPRLVK